MEGGNLDEPKLSVADDPLAYLGILVDILQEWDRYAVYGSGPFGGTLPVQAQDVDVSQTKGKIHLNYGDKDIADKVTKALSKSLVDWDVIVKIGPSRLTNR